ncbi:MAG: DUF5667 domain-containing protein [Candidatus Methanoperedens sp.]|nr:DUF5667 domain-containing protein [Candidatus Methanoperedens sp.]
MRLRNITMAGIILLMLVFVISPINAVADSATSTDTGTAVDTSRDETQLGDDVPLEENIIGPDHVLYKLRMALEDLDVAFTFNDSEKADKQVSQARHRLAEIKAAFKNNNEKAAESAIAQYQEETVQTEETISRHTGRDTGLLRAQSRIANHSFVLERLLESHPNNSGLLRAYNNSRDLIEKFALRTNIRFERTTDKMGREVMKHVKIEDDSSDNGEKTTIKASVEDNKTRVKVELKFLTNSTTNDTIARDILDRINAIESNVSGLIKIERNGGSTDEVEVEDVNGGTTRTLTASTLKVSGEKTKAQAEVKGNTTKVTFEYQFFLNETDDAAIIDGVKIKLSALTAQNIQDVLDVKVKEMKDETSGRKIEDRPKVETTEKKLDDNSGKSENRNSRAVDN